jgi:hypothetical protein
MVSNSGSDLVQRFSGQDGKRKAKLAGTEQAMPKTDLRAGLAALLAALALASPGEAHALPDPVRAAALQPICADRPGKGTAPCTAPAGHLQIEIDAFDLTHDRSAGQADNLYLLASPQLKLGLTDRLDVEAGAVAYQHQTGSGGGVGDLYLRAKASLLDEDKGGVGLALQPYLKLPTARRGLGNGAVEAGLVAPAEIALPHGWKLDLTTEADRLENEDGGGRHWAGSETLGLNHPLGGGFTGAAELWAERDLDPGGHASQYSADFALSWVPRSGRLQLDGGVNLGLNHETPDLQLYMGLSRLF